MSGFQVGNREPSAFVGSAQSSKMRRGVSARSIGRIAMSGFEPGDVVVCVDNSPGRYLDATSLAALAWLRVGGFYRVSDACEGGIKLEGYPLGNYIFDSPIIPG